MSKQAPRPRQARQPVVVEVVTDPVEIAAAEERHRQYKKTALGQMGPVLVCEAPFPLLAQYIVELPADEQQEFLTELINRLPLDVLSKVGELLRARIGSPSNLATAPPPG